MICKHHKGNVTICNKENFISVINFAYDNDGQLLGAISFDHFRSIPKQLWSETLTKEVMGPIAESTTVQADRPLLEVMQLIEKHKLSALTVIRDNGVLVGILEKTAILSWLQKKMLSNPA